MATDLLALDALTALGRKNQAPCMGTYKTRKPDSPFGSVRSHRLAKGVFRFA